MTSDSGEGWNSGPSTDGETFTDGDSTSEHVGFLERLWQSLVGILIGFGLIAATIWGIFWNEGRAIGTTRALNEGAGVTVSVPAARVDPANEGRLVYTSGNLSGGQLADGEFQIRSQAVRLVRKVEMYQWKEERRTENRSNAGGSQTRTTTYSYERTWSDRPISSQDFRQRDGHQNPAMPVTGRTETASGAMLGAFRADSRVIGLFGSSSERKLDVAQAQLGAFQSRFGSRAQLNDGGVYVGSDPGNPQIGDLRISYSILPEGAASIVARQNGEGFGPYAASNGREVFLGATGTRTAQELYQGAHETNRIITWVLRAAMLFAVWLGFFLILRPFVVLADVIPIFGSAMAAGAGLVSVALALVVFLPTIAIAWFWHRPVMSIALIVAGFAGAYGLRMLGERRRAAKAGTPVAGGQPMGYQPAYAGHEHSAPQGGYPQGYPQQGYPQQGYAQQPAPAQPMFGHPPQQPQMNYAQPAPGYPPEYAQPPQPLWPTAAQAVAETALSAKPAAQAPRSFLDVPPELRPKQGG
jgi:hypothetical protein